MLYLPTARLWHVALADGTPRPVTSGEASYMHPDIGRSGTVVATRLDLRSDIWKYPIDGSPHVNMQAAVHVTHQTGHVLTPTAGPGDQELAFLSDRGGHANLWVVNLRNGTLRQITNQREPDVTVGVPVWSPAGGSIAFVSSRPPSDAPSDPQLEQSRPPWASGW